MISYSFRSLWERVSPTNPNDLSCSIYLFLQSWKIMTLWWFLTLSGLYGKECLPPTQITCPVAYTYFYGLVVPPPPLLFLGTAWRLKVLEKGTECGRTVQSVGVQGRRYVKNYGRSLPNIVPVGIQWIRYVPSNFWRISSKTLQQSFYRLRHITVSARPGLSDSTNQAI